MNRQKETELNAKEYGPTIHIRVNKAEWDGLKKLTMNNGHSHVSTFVKIILRKILIKQGLIRPDE